MQITQAKEGGGAPIIQAAQTAVKNQKIAFSLEQKFISRPEREELEKKNIIKPGFFFKKLIHWI